MAKRVGIFASVWKNILSLLQGGHPQRVVVGRDSFGNIYYETDPGTSADPVNRGYLPADGDNWDRIPVEWRCWLSRQRNEPPTQEEIEFNNLQTARRMIAAHEEHVAQKSIGATEPEAVQELSNDSSGQARPFPRRPDLEQFTTNIPGRKNE